MLEDKNIQRTPLSNMGEFKLIEHLTTPFENLQNSTKLGIGDDAAVLNFKDKEVVVTTDFLLEGVHFDLAYMPLKHLGYKAVIASLSDVCAMNAKPTHITVSIAVSNRFPVEALEELYEGVRLACQIYKVDLIGGDTTSSLKGLVISVTALGEVEEGKVIKRSGAKEGDLLVLTGDIGAAYMGLQILEREKQVFQVNPNNQPDLEPYSYLIERQLKPEARNDIKDILENLEVAPTSMIDISDGLSSEILHLSKSSGVGFRIYEEKLPLDPQFIQVCEEFNIDSTTIALSGGEDYELLFTVPISCFDKIKGNPNLTVIGYVTNISEGNLLITRAGEAVAIKARGWDSIKSE